MASYFSSFLPQSAQKRLLKYILTTYAPVLDSSTLDLDKLDVQIGRKSVISLSDVGIDGTKLHALLNLPPEFHITSGSVGSFTANLPADLHRSGIEVFIDQVKIIATLLPPLESQDGKNKKRKGRRKDKTSGEKSRMRSSMLPTPEEVARKFVQKQPKKVKERMEKSVMAASGFWKDGLDSIDLAYRNNSEDDDEHQEDEITAEDLYAQPMSRGASGSSSVKSGLQSHHSEEAEDESSDDDALDDPSDDEDVELGTGTGLSLPGFVASFIKGIGDRFQLHVGEVSASIQISKSQAFPESIKPLHMSSILEEKMVTLELRMAGVAIEGVTFATAEVDISAFAPSASGQIKEGKRKIQLNRLNAFLIGDESLFDEGKPATTDMNPEQTGFTGYDGTDSQNGQMTESVCTIKDLEASVATLRAASPPPPPPAPPPGSTPPPELMPEVAFEPTLRKNSTTSFSSSDDDFYSNPDESIAEDDRLAASVVSLGSMSDNGTALTSQPEPLTESQMFADPDSDSDEERGGSEPAGNGEELPFAMASYMENREDGNAQQYSRNSIVQEPAPENLLLPPSPADPVSHGASPIPQPPKRPLSAGNISTVRQPELQRQALYSSSPALLPHQATKTSPPQISPEDPVPPPLAVISPGTSSPRWVPGSPRDSTILSDDGRYGSYYSQSNSETESEDDEAARKKLSESMFFSHEDAGSLYLSAMSGVLDPPSRHFEQYTFDGARDVDNAIKKSVSASVGAGRRKGDVEGEELTEAEIEARLDKLVGSVSRRGSEQQEPIIPSEKKIRKKIAEIDYIEVWIPALSTPAEKAPTTAAAEISVPSARSPEEGGDPHLPGAFSIYGASPPLNKGGKFGTSSPRPITPRSPVPGVKFAEGPLSPARSPSNKPEMTPKTREKDAEVEVFVGKIEMKTDLVMGGLLAKIFGALGILGANTTADAEVSGTGSQSKNTDAVSGKRLEVVVGEVDCRLVDKVTGQILLENGQPETKGLGDDETEPVMIFDMNVQHTRVTMSTIVPKTTSSMAGEIVKTTKVAFANIEFRDTKGAFIEFVTTPPTCLEPSPHAHPGKRRTSSTEKGIAMQSDVNITVTTAGNKTKIDVETLPLHVECQFGRVEEMLSYLGGFGSMMGLSTAGLSRENTPTPTTPKPRGVSWKDDGARPTPQAAAPIPTAMTTQPGELKLDVNIGGLVVDIEGEDAAVGLRTSVIKIRKKNELATVIGIEKIIVLGPDLVGRVQDSDASIIIENTRLEFSSKPNDDDLARLLKLLTPSNDKFTQDDDILLDTLIKQRKQASVLRVSVARVNGEAENLRNCERLLSLGEEASKILSVTKYMPQDERPGLLTLLYVGMINARVDIGEVVGKLELGVRNFDLSHVSGPNLLALAMGNIEVIRNGEEELLGEGLPKDIAIRGFAKHAATGGTRHVLDEEDRPMVMVRIVGDDPEPVIKVKLWNLRVEYNINTLMALIESPNATGDEIAREMVDSIVTLTEKQVRKDQMGKKKKHVNSPLETTVMASPTAATSTKPLRVEIAVRDSVLGLNPLALSSRGLVILTESRFFIELPSPKAELEINVEIKRASLSLIDDIANILTLEEAIEEAGRHRRRKEALTEHLAAFAQLGYVSIASISSARVVLKLVESEVPGDKCIDLEVWDDLFFMETCADSTQTLLGVINGLKPPLPEGEEVKYLTEVMPVDMFASLIEDAFAPPHRRKGTNTDSQTGGSSTSSGEKTQYLEIQEGLGKQADEDSLDGDMVRDDVPMNLTFVESYYGNPNVNYNYTQEELAEDMLDEGDLTHIAKPSRPLGVGERGVLKTFEEQVQMLDDTPLEITDNHFSVVPRASLIEMAANSAIGAPVRVKVKDVHVIWNLHDGYDWRKTRDTISKAVKKVEGKVLQRRSVSGGGDARASNDMDDEDQAESVIGDFLFNSIYIGIPTNRDPKELTKQINTNLETADLVSETGSYASTAIDSSRPSSRSRANPDPLTRRHRSSLGGSGLRLTRSKTHKMQIELKGVSAEFILFPQNAGECQSSVDLKVRDLEIIDNVPTSTWKKFVTYMRDAGKRETGSNMAHIEVLNVKPVPTLAASELVIKATILPLRLHVDQDTLDFMTRFFEFKDDTVIAATPSQDEPFIQRIEVNAVRVKLDYKPKRVDYAGLRSGHTTEFMNFIILEEADMILKHVILHGIPGFTRLSKALNDTWMPDIQRTQLGDVLSGVAPVRSLVNLGSGVRDLVIVPVREYRKDGRLVRSVRKGLVAFVGKTTKELVRLGAKVAVGTQTVLENAEEFLGGQGSGGRADGTGAYYYHRGSDVFGLEGDIDDDDDAGEYYFEGNGERVKVISLYADQPKNVAQGLRNAGSSLRRNLISARDAIRAVPGEVAEMGSAQGVVRAVARAAPVAVLRPMIGASEAVSRTLLGVGNTLDKEGLRRVDEKYKKH